MDKKQIMKMNDMWKDFRLNESLKIFKDGAQHGFDLTDFKPGGFKRFLKALGIPMRSKIGNPDKGFQWKGRGILIVTGNDPITVGTPAQYKKWFAKRGGKIVSS